MTDLDDTHDPARRSWVATANGDPDFPIQNLPLGVYDDGVGAPGIGVAIGDRILSLPAVADRLGLSEQVRTAIGATHLNALFRLGAEPRRALRRAVSALLSEGSAVGREGILRLRADCALHVPAAIGDYTDFFAGIHHARNAGRQFRPDTPLLPNYKYVPVAYHGRASSVRASGSPVRRPNGQRKPASETVPSYGPSRNLDYELELGIWIGAPNDPGTPVPIAGAAEGIAGYCLLNDWSARDIQAWEAQPLGPFLAKSFHTSVSPWVVTPEALAPFRVAQAARPEGDPAPLPHLLDAADQQAGALAIEVEVLLLTGAMRAAGAAPERLSAASARDLYWTPAQMVAHHTSNGCDLHPGDLFGSGTISGEAAGSFGSLLELTAGGRQPITLASGETRRFLEDGDAVILRGRCRRDGAVGIGFGECRGTIVAAATG